MLSSTITTKGQVTIPVEFRRELGFEVADRVVFVCQQDAVLIKKVPDLETLYGSLGKKQVKALSVTEMEELSEKMFEGSE